MNSATNKFAAAAGLRLDINALLHLLQDTWTAHLRRDSTLFVKIPLHARLSAEGCPQAKLRQAVYAGMCALVKESDEASLLVPVNESIVLQHATMTGPSSEHWFLPRFGFFIPGEYLIGLPLGLGAQLRSLPSQASYVQQLKPEYAATLVCPGCDCFAFNASSELSAHRDGTPS